MKLNFSIIIDRAILLFTFVAALLFIATAFNSFYWMDDFWKRYEVLNTGFFQFQWDIYWNWDGRGLSPVYALRNLMLWLFDYPQSWAVTLITMSFLFGTSFFIVKFLIRENWTKFSILHRVITVLLVSFVLIMIFRPHLSRSFYWATGSFYTLANFSLIYLIYRLINRPESNWNLLWLFVAVSTGPNSGLVALCFLLLGQVSKLLKLKKSTFWLMLVLGLITLLLITIAPGNFGRANGRLDFSIFSLYKGGISILEEYAGMSLWVLLGAIVLTLSLRQDIKASNLKLPIILTISAFASILPFLPIPMAASKHTAIHFQTFLLIGGVLACSCLLKKIVLSVPHLVSQSIVFLFLVFFAFQIANQFKMGRLVKIQIDQRMMVLEENKNSERDVLVAPVSVPERSWTSMFWDIKENSDYFSNVYLKNYFGIKSVALKNSTKTPK